MVNVVKRTREFTINAQTQFKESVVPTFEPAIIRGYISAWKAVYEAKVSPQALANYITQFDNGSEIITYRGAPSIKGRMFYNDGLSGFNFERVPNTLASSIRQIMEVIDDDSAPSIYSGSVDTETCLPGFSKENKCDLAGKTAKPRIWVGNSAVVSTHYDLLDNIVCNVSGKRRFLLFPPEQISNLYVGPIDYTLSGQPVSMVDPNNPNFGKFPKFKEALQHAEVAELSPGDVLFMPKLWWHHVESLDKLNVIVNYWWDETSLSTDNPYANLLYAILTIKHLPVKERQAWKAFFEHYIFLENGDPAAHIPEGKKGVLGNMTPPLYRQLKNQVASLILKR